jgi:hypothetical protein
MGQSSRPDSVARRICPRGSRLEPVGRPTIYLEARGAPDDDPSYSWAVVIESKGTEGSWDWVELLLRNVDERAQGEQRVVNAQVIARVWLGYHHVDVPYHDSLGFLENAKTSLLEGEKRVAPH